MNCAVLTTRIIPVVRTSSQGYDSIGHFAVLKKLLIYNEICKCGVTRINTEYAEMIKTQHFVFYAK